MKIPPINNSVSQVKNIARTVRANGKEGVQIARRVSQLKGSNAFAGKMLEFKSFIKHAVAPFFEWAAGKSNTVKTIVDTSKKVSRNITKNVGRAVEKNPKASKFVAGLKGVDASLPALGSAALVVTGIKDVNDARKNEGTAAGVKEAGKSAVRVTTSAALATAGAILLPVPGMATAGWLAGEKLANLVVGKPYSSKDK